jgi:pimeloyl-ACP methyl ester carboxylesterase
MKTFIRRILKTIGVTVTVLVTVIVLFWIRAELHESEMRKDAAPSTGRFVQAGDVELFIQEMGPADGRSIVFIHGTAAWSEFWRETMIPLANAGFHCIAIDIPPFGFSEKPARPSYGNKDQATRIVALLDALDVSNAILIGHSFGGGATMEAALMIPDRIDALVLLDVGGLNLNLEPSNEGDGVSALSVFMNTPLLRNPVLAATATNPLLTKTITSTMVLDPGVVTNKLKSLVRQPLVLKDATDTFGEWLTYVLTVQEVSLTSDPSNYAVLTMPALIIWGDSDTIIPLKDGEYLQSILPNAELVVMKGVNHIPYIENNDDFIEITLNFLNR